MVGMYHGTGASINQRNLLFFAHGDVMGMGIGTGAEAWGLHLRISGADCNILTTSFKIIE